MEFSPQPRDRSAERRRSQRISLTLPVCLAWEKGDGIYVRENAHTENISTHGALLRMEHALSLHSAVTVDRGGRVTVARVVRCGLPGAEGWRPVGVELVYPNEVFWFETSPPAI